MNYQSSKVALILFNDFLRNKNGNFAIIFALALIPVLGVIGVAIDYARALEVRTHLASALDSALLAAKQEYDNDNSVDLNEVITAFINANYDKAGSTISSRPEVSHSVGKNGALGATATAGVPTTFTQLLNFKSIPVSASSTVTNGGTSIEVALVVDNSGSMMGSKLSSLEKSATDMVDALMPKNKSDNAKIALVPFSSYVNIGTKHRNEPGVDVPADYSVKRKAGCWNTYPNSTRKCKKTEYKTTCYNDGVPYTCTKTKYSDCTGDSGDPVEKCSSGKTVEYRWYGCVASREAPLNTSDDSYWAEVPGMMGSSNNCEYSELTRLTNNKETIRSGIGKMKARGETYLPAGLMWGWRALSDSIPFADGVSYSELQKVKKAIVLMTDGANTKSMKLSQGEHTQNNKDGLIWSHDAGDFDEANYLASELCDNIKAEDVMIYTIAFDVADPTVKALMSNCAGNGGKYYGASDRTELAAAFKKIAASLQSLRLSK